MAKPDPEKLVSEIVGIIVGPKSKYSVTKSEDGNLIKIEIQVAKEDLGKVIGKGGATVLAIRKLAGITGVNLNKKVLVSLSE